MKNEPHLSTPCALSNAKGVLWVYLAGEVFSKIRRTGRTGGVMPHSGNGLYDPRCVDDHRRASLLQDDAEPMRADGNARVLRLLP